MWELWGDCRVSSFGFILVCSFGLGGIRFFLFLFVGLREECRGFL